MRNAARDRPAATSGPLIQVNRRLSTRAYTGQRWSARVSDAVTFRGSRTSRSS